MKYFSCFLFSFLFVFSMLPTQGQTFYLSYPLQNAKKNDPVAQEEFRAYLEISKRIMLQSADSSFRKASLGYQSALKKKDAEAIAFFETMLGDILKIKGSYASSGRYYYNALTYYCTSKDTIKIVSVLASLADLYRAIGEYQAGLDMLEYAQILYNANLNEPHILATIHANNAAIYFEILSIGFNSLINKTYGARLPEHDILSMEMHAEQLLKGNIRKSFLIASKSCDTMLMIKSLNLLAKNQHINENFDAALNHYNYAYELILKTNIISEKALILSNMSTTYMAIQNWEQALKYATLAYEDAVASNILLYRWLASRNLFLIYKNMGDYKKALLYKERDADISSIIHNEKARKQLYLAGMKHKSSLQIDQIKKLEQEKAFKQRIDNLMTILFIFVVSLLTLLTLMIHKKGQNARRRKSETEKENLIKADLLQKAENARKTKNEFLADLSHEIRTPMSAMMGYAELLNHTGIDKQQKDYIKGILYSGKILLELINDLLDLSRLESKKTVLAPRPVDLHSLCNEAAKIVEYQLRKNNITFSQDLINLEKKLFILDETRIKQILLNIIGNAVKYTLNGKINLTIIATTLDNGHANIHCSVKDNGMGISSDQLKTIFDPFHQSASGVTKESHLGFGLGLAITKNLVNVMNGEISITSVLGAGTTITIEIPDIPFIYCQGVQYESCLTENEPSAAVALLTIEEAAYFQQQLLPLWIETKKLMSKDDIEDFALRVHQYGSEHSIKVFIDWAEEVRTHAKNFDIRQLYDTFNTFQLIIKQDL